LDTFINIENLKEFLNSKDPRYPTTFGYDSKTLVEGGYHSGGAGYVLSHEALRRLGDQLAMNLSFCEHYKFEDVDVQKCLRKLQVFPSKSIDELGRERFHMIGLKDSFLGRFMKGQAEWAAHPLKQVSC
jgi:glycoprotein-N-acetylgalactosamine 3-beta-galactosyltransferase